MQKQDANRIASAWLYFKHVQSVTENTPNVLEDRRKDSLHEDNQEASQQSRLLHGATGLASEAGEILGYVLKRLFRYKKQPVEPLSKEIGDAIWFLALIIDAAGLDLAQILIDNGVKLTARHIEKFSETQADEADRLLVQYLEQKDASL